MQIFLATGCLVVTLATGMTHAALISASDPVYGPGSITRDTGTGLEWLDLTLSTNHSVNDILGGASGFLANGFVIATLPQIEAMYTNGGWDGVDDSATAGSVGHLAFVQLMQSLFGITGVSGTPGETTFNEGWALTTIPNRVSRPFNTISQNGIAGRVACTTVGFNTFTGVNTFSGCRMDYDQRFDFIGAYLVRPTAEIPEPATLLLLGWGVSALAFGLRMRKRFFLSGSERTAAQRYWPRQVCDPPWHSRILHLSYRFPFRRQGV